ncbi:hypothetical protein GGR57DRAFT_305541 [Xylariaceae sp. FL1272]|nr:hypothetical protein GGR57DRAFT_305541 [Xylariaceae sp. FL1272]
MSYHLAFTPRSEGRVVPGESIVHLSFGPQNSTPAFKDFTNTFVLSPTSKASEEQTLLEVPKALDSDPSRKRRSHKKSNAGCRNCKSRRVKCDEASPCSNCARRGDQCELLDQGRRLNPCATMPTTALSSRSGPPDAKTDLLHLKLVHHFQTFTRDTLLIAYEAWDYALQLSFEFDFLMDAVLGMAARHLAVLHPNDTTYEMVAASHICRASSSLRKALSKGVRCLDFDAFIATSILFYYDTWCCAEYHTPLNIDHEASDTWTDRVFGFSSSLKKTLLKGFDRPPSSYFAQYLVHDPGAALSNAAQANGNAVPRCREFFSYGRPIESEMLNTPHLEMPKLSTKRPTRSSDTYSSVSPTHASSPIGTEDFVESAYVPVVDRLSSILPFLPEERRKDQESTSMRSVTPLLARYILSMPLLGWNSFPVMVDRADPHALLVLYHFYRAARILLDDERWWWAQRRSVAAEKALGHQLSSLITHTAKP